MEDWVRTIIIVLVIGSSVLAPVVKKLIAAFGNKGEAGEKNKREPLPPATKRQPAHPVARPLPQRGQPIEREAMTVDAIPVPPHTSTGDAIDRPRPEPVARPRPVQRQEPAQRVETARPVAREEQPARPTRPTARTEQPTRPAQPTPRPKPSRRRERTHAAQPTKPRRAQEDSHYARPHSETELEWGERPAKQTIDMERITHPTNAEWRRAVLLSEILAPPLAPRPQQERY